MINERLLLLEGAARKWHISILAADGTPVDMTAYTYYGGAANRSRTQQQVMNLLGTSATEAVLELPALPYGEWWHHQIYMRESATGREWLLVAGRIEVQERLGEDAVPGTLSAVECWLEYRMADTGSYLGGSIIYAGPAGPIGESGHLQPVDPATPGDLTLTPGHILDLGTLTTDTDLTALSFAESANVQTAELWFTTGTTAPVITWPADAAWMDGLLYGIDPSTAYRFALRREPNGKLIINLAYHYAV